MTSLLEDPFAHHVWATVRLLDSCMELQRSQLETSVPGTYGSVLDRLRHLVGTDAWYRHRLEGWSSEFVDEKRMDLAQLSTVMEAAAEVWTNRVPERARTSLANRDAGEPSLKVKPVGHFPDIL